MDQAYTDKLDGKIDEQFWSRKNLERQGEERELMAQIAAPLPNIQQHALNVERVLELANKVYLLYSKQTSTEQGELLQMVVSKLRDGRSRCLPKHTESRSTSSRKEQKRENGAPGRIRTSDLLIRSYLKRISRIDANR